MRALISTLRAPCGVAGDVVIGSHARVWTVDPVGRKLGQRFDGRGARFAPAAKRLVNRAAARSHRELLVMTSSTTSNPGAGEAVLLKDTVTEYRGPKSEPVAASISRLVWSLKRRNVPTG